MATLGEYLPNSNTKLLYHFNGSSADSSGNGNNGLDTSMTYNQANGKFGQGAGFVTNSYINFPVTNLPTGNSPYTFSILIKPTSLPSLNTEAYVLGYGNSGNNFQSAGIILKNISGVQYVRAYIWGGDLDYAITLPTTSWTNIIHTFDGTTASLYINGNLYISGARTMNLIQGTLHNWGRNDGGTPLLNASLDECIIENTGWNASKVRKYYTQVKGMFGIIN